MSKISDFIKKLQILPEGQKKVIFFITLFIFALIIGFFTFISTKKNILEIKKSLKSSSLPGININNIDVKLNASNLDKIYEFSSENQGKAIEGEINN